VIQSVCARATIPSAEEPPEFWNAYEISAETESSGPRRCVRNDVSNASRGEVSPAKFVSKPSRGLNATRRTAGSNSSRVLA